MSGCIDVYPKEFQRNSFTPPASGLLAIMGGWHLTVVILAWTFPTFVARIVTAKAATAEK